MAADHLAAAAAALGIELLEDDFTGVGQDLTRLEQFCHEIAHALALRIPIEPDDMGLQDAVTVALALLDPAAQLQHEALARRVVMAVFKLLGTKFDEQAFELRAQKDGLGPAYRAVPHKAVGALANGVRAVLIRKRVWP